MKLPAMIAYVILRWIFAPVFLVADLLTYGWAAASDDFIAMRISLGDSPVVDLYHWQFMLAWLLLRVIAWSFWPVRKKKEFTDHLIDSGGD